jgi:hypothetical protein
MRIKAYRCCMDEIHTGQRQEHFCPAPRRINWKWPGGPGSIYNPWYDILWRLLWFVPVTISRVLFALFVGIAARDHRTALEAWRDTR